LHLIPGAEANTVKYRVDWGDGQSTTTADTAARTLTHTYATEHTGRTPARHAHGLGEGHRIAHCQREAPYTATGYNLALADAEVTDLISMKRDRAARSARAPSPDSEQR
jgi:hypothetical protein